MSEVGLPDATPLTDDGESAFAELVARLSDQIQTDEPIDLDGLCATYPHWNLRLRRLMPGLQSMGRPYGQADSTPATGDIPSAWGASAIGSLSDFQIIREVGRGGMGVVYEAVQLSLCRPVALKVLAPLPLVDPGRLRRFQAEAVVAAALNHPHIVPVHAIGAENGVHFFAMQLIEQDQEFECRTRKPAAREIAELGRQAAEALSHAHAHAVIHRDIKPTNLLVDRSGWLRIADFGLALRPESLETTASGLVVGTLRYMSPEQLVGGRKQIDHRVDIYSLGATLYEWLAGRPAFEGDDRIELLELIARREPLPLRAIDATIPHDLATIVQKAMAKLPGDRYATAAELAADLARFIYDEPIVARAPGLLQRAGRWTSRHKQVVVGAGLLFVASALLGQAAWRWRDRVLRGQTGLLTDALVRADRSEQASERIRYGSELRRAQQALTSHQSELAQDILEGLRSMPGKADLRGLEWSLLRRLSRREVTLLARHEGSVQHVVLSPDARVLVSIDSNGTAVFWNVPEERERFRVNLRQTGISGGRFSPDGKLFAVWRHSPAEVTLCDAVAGVRRTRVPGITDDVLSLAFSCDAGALLVRQTGAQLDSSRDRTTFWNIDRDSASVSPGMPPIDSLAVAFSPSGRTLVTAEASGPIVLRDFGSGKVVKMLAEHFPHIGNLTFSPDGQMLAASHDKGVTIWDTESAGQKSFIALNPPPDSLEFSSDGARLAGTTWIRHDLVFINQVRSDQPAVSFAGITGERMRYSLSPDGKTLASAGIGLAAALWDTATGQKKAAFTGAVREINALVFAPDGRSVFLGCGDGRVRAWHTAPEPPPVRALEGCKDEVWALAYAPRGDSLFSAADDHLITVWNPRTGLRVGELRGHQALVASLVIERTGTTLASASFDSTVRLWDLATLTEKLVLRGHSGVVRAVAFSPDGRQVASGGDDNVVRLWDVAGGHPLAVILGHTANIRALSFDPRGKYLVSAGNDRTIRILDRDANALLQILKGATNIASLAFSPDGAFLAAGDEGGNVTIWHTSSWENRALMRVCEASVWGLSYSPDGETLAAACGDATVRLLQPNTSQILLELDGHATRVNAVAFAPSGRAVASASHDGAVKVWSADAP